MKQELEILRKMIEMSLRGKSANEIADELFPAFQEIRSKLEQEKVELQRKRKEILEQQKASE